MNSSKVCTRPASARLRRHRGASMIFALITLAVMALAAVGLVRSVDTTTLALGNLGFKQDATAASAGAAEAAIVWIQANAASLNNTDAASGYYATDLITLDVTGASRDPLRAIVNWDGACLGRAPADYTVCLTPAAAVAVNNNTARFLISRMCSEAGEPGGPAASGGTVVCTRPASSSVTATASHGEVKAGEEESITSSAAGSPYYRILVRTQGGRNTVSYTETIVHF